MCALGQARRLRCRPPRSSCDGAPTHSALGRDDLRGAGGRRSRQRSCCRKKSAAAGDGCREQPRVADETGWSSREGVVAEHVIHVHVSIDEVAHRQASVLRSARAQRAPDAHRAAAVDDGDAARADDEADVGDVVMSGGIERAAADRSARTHRAPPAGPESSAAGRGTAAPCERGPAGRHRQRWQRRRGADRSSASDCRRLHRHSFTALRRTAPIRRRSALSFESVTSKMHGFGSGSLRAMRSVGFSLSEMPASASISAFRAAAAGACA